MRFGHHAAKIPHHAIQHRAQILHPTCVPCAGSRVCVGGRVRVGGPGLFRARFGLFRRLPRLLRWQSAHELAVLGTTAPGAPPSRRRRVAVSVVRRRIGESVVGRGLRPRAAVLGRALRRLRRGGRVERPRTLAGREVGSFLPPRGGGRLQRQLRPQHAWLAGRLAAAAAAAPRPQLRAHAEPVEQHRDFLKGRPGLGAI